MKKRKIKYIGACDSYQTKHYGKPRFCGYPIVKEYDYTKNGAGHFAMQCDFITDTTPYISCDSVWLKYPIKM